MTTAITRSHPTADAVRRFVARAVYVVHRIIGVPDYGRYVSHMGAHHPGATPMTREEFVRRRLADRYSKPGSRCC